MSPVWETFANASVNGYRTSIKGVNYWLARVQYASRPSGAGTAGGAAANSTNAYYTFANSLGRFLHRFNQDGTFSESRTIAGGNNNLGWPASTNSVLAFSTGGGSLYFTTPSNYFASGSARNVEAQAPQVSIDSSGFVYANDNGLGQARMYKYNSTGTIQFIRTFSGLSTNQGCPDTLGNNFTPSTGAPATVHKMDSSGAYQWGRQFSSFLNNSGIRAICGDGSGGVIVEGNVSGPCIYRFLSDGSGGFGLQATLGGVTLTTAGVGVFGNFAYWVLGQSNDQNCYVVKTNLSGTVQWQRSFIGSGLWTRSTNYTGMKVEADENAVYFSGITSPNTGTYEHAYCFKYPADGAVTGSFNLGGPSNLVISASSISITGEAANRNVNNSSTSAAGSESSNTYSTSAVTTTAQIVKVP
jgi:hypothetical protein